MDGVFINLTDTDVKIRDQDDTFIIPANLDLVTPVKDIVLTECIVNGIISVPLKENDIRYLQGTQWTFNTFYNKITRSETELKVSVSLLSPYVKYPFTLEQIEKINRISNKRTRLFITTEKEARYWSDGKFECPFRNYRLFVSTEDSLIEYPIPKTYLDVVIEGVKNLGDKLRT